MKLNIKVLLGKAKEGAKWCLLGKINIPYNDRREIKLRMIQKQ